MGFLKYKNSLQSKKGIYNVLIIGAGNIGAFYDTPDSKNILTHAHAIKEHPGFKLVGFVDNDSERAKVAATIWETSSFQSIDEAFSKTDVDVVCVAVPDEFHYTVLKEVVFRAVKIVLAEKPITKTLVEADEIIALYNQLNVSLLVNYTRRFVPEFQDVKKLIYDQSFGKYVFGAGYYGKGVLHNGSHMINLLEYLIGDVKEVEVKEKVFDFYNDDPSVSARLTLENGRPFNLQYIDQNMYTIFEMDLFFENTRIRIIDSGYKILFSKVSESSILKGYKTLSEVKELETSLGCALNYTYENVFSSLANGEVLISSHSSARKSMATCLKISSSPL